MPQRTNRWTRARRVRAIGVASLVLAAAIVGLVAIFPGAAPTEETDESDTGQHTAVDLDSYVGWRKCAECHEEQAAAYTRSGHSHTFALSRDSNIAQSLCGHSIRESDAYGLFEYECDDEGLMVGLAERFGGDLFPLDYAFGSGKHAVTCLSLVPNRAGETVGIEHRLTWFATDDALDVTPGQEDLLPAQRVEFFGRVIRDADLLRCIDCHTTTGEIVEHRLANIIANVQCEECHGPGRAHVAAAESGNEDAMLRAIARPVSGSEEIALCGRCHRLPAEIASDRLERYPNSLVRFQPVGLLQSRCHTQSSGGLACTTCHNPHEPAGSVSSAEHEQTCLRCHGGVEQTECPVSPRTDCVSCHMPSIELVRGISFHDHWIRVRSGDAPDASERGGSHSTVSSDR